MAVLEADVEATELARIDRLLDLERQGVPLRITETPDARRSYLHYPPAPVRAALSRLLAEADGEEAPAETVAGWLRMSARRVIRIRDEFAVLDEIQVDHIATMLYMRVEDFYSPELRQLAHDNRPLARRGKKVRGSAREVLAWIDRVERTCEGLA